MEADIRNHLDRIERMLIELIEARMIKDYYEIEEFARLIGKSGFTVREWARYHRIHAIKRKSGRGPYKQWVISHEELLRYRREGLLPLTISK